MEKEFIPYELAVKLKELGFNQPVFAWFNLSKQLEYENNYGYRNYIESPLWQQAFDWCLNLTAKQHYLRIIQDNDTFTLEKINNGKTHYLVVDKDRYSVLEKLIELTKGA